jgi:NADPH:quinone reductase-like Zn-dependent oxidoreductase
MWGYRITHHGGPEVLTLADDLPVPAVGPGEVRVRVAACGLNHLDLWVRNGVPGHRYPLPLVPGSEIAGVVEAVGPGVSGIVPGQPTLVAPGLSCGICPACLAGEDPLCPQYGILGETRDGGYAGLVTVPARNILPHPPGLSFAQAAAVPLTFLTAWHMLVTRARLRPHETVLVHAAGSGVSTAAIQIARLWHAGRIIATAGSDEKLALARRLGADETINYRHEDFVARVRCLVGRSGVDVVIDHVGGEVFAQSVRILGRGGRIVLCGATAGAEASINLRAVFFKGLSILGSTMGGLGELRTLLGFVGRGELVPVVDRVFPFAEAAAAQERLARREAAGKLVLAVGDDALSVPVPAPSTTTPEGIAP